MPLVSKSYGSLDPAQLTGTIWTAFVEFQLYLIAPFSIPIYRAARDPSLLAAAGFVDPSFESHGDQHHRSARGLPDQLFHGYRPSKSIPGRHRCSPTLSTRTLIPKQLREGRAPAFALIGATAAILGFVTLLSNLGGLKVLNRGNTHLSRH